ncbi:MAG: Flp pilus assembly protein CpaB [Maritimibacter sp.]
MRAVFGLVLILGVGLAGFAVYMARGYIGDYQTQLDRERAARAQMVPLTEVYVVNETLAYGDQVTEENIRAVRWPEDAVPEGTFKTLDEIFPEGEKRYRTVVRAMEKDEALLEIKVTRAGGDAGVSSRLSSGMRAFAIKVDVATGVSGFLRPDDTVDIYWTGRGSVDSVTSQEVTKLIQSRIRIIAIDQMADTDRAAPTIARTVTVEATPQQVARLAQAQATGRLSLSLVGAGDDSTASAVEIDQNELLGIQTDAPEIIAEKQVCTIRTRKGAETVQVEIPCPTN